MSAQAMDRSDNNASRRVMAVALVLIYGPMLALVCFGTSFSAVERARSTIATTMQRAARPLPALPVIRTVEWKDIEVRRDPFLPVTMTPAVHDTTQRTRK